MRASALAARLGIGASALSRQLADLEQAGFVDRAPDPLDGRASLLSLSPRGERYLTETYERRAATLREILSDWTESEAEAASSSVQHLASALRSAAHDAGAPGVSTTGTTRTTRTTYETGNDGRHHQDTPSQTTKEDR